MDGIHPRRAAWLLPLELPVEQELAHQVGVHAGESYSRLSHPQLPAHYL